MTWIERINAGRQSGKFATGDVALAAEWVTCACGEQDERIPRHAKTGHEVGSGYAPLDGRLFSLGVRFYEAVEKDDFDRAESVLGDIETRAAEILAEL